MCTVSLLITYAQCILFKISNYPKANKTICISQERICPSEGGWCQAETKNPLTRSEIAPYFSLRQDKKKSQKLLVGVASLLHLGMTSLILIIAQRPNMFLILEQDLVLIQSIACTMFENQIKSKKKH